MIRPASPCLAAVAVSVVLLAGCSAADDEPAIGPGASPALPTAGAQTVAGPTAQQVIDAFAAAGLPVSNPRDNSANCESLGCSELVTTDAISVYIWPSEETAQHQVDVGLADSAYRQGLVVLSYAAAQTPEADRPLYEAELAKLG